MRYAAWLLPGLLAAGVAGFLLTITLTGILPLPWGFGSATTEARTIALEGGSFGSVAEPPSIPAPGGGNPLVSFQGRLTNPGTGLPVANGAYSITFRIYDAPAGGNNLWQETQGAVSVNGGLFNVLLGSVTPLDAGVFSATNRYLDVQVSPDAAMSTRLQFGYVPFAFQAEQAGTVSRLGFSTTAVDSAGLVGTWASITIGGDGLPVISYRDDTNSDLKVAHCGNAACTAGNTLTAVDSAGNVGESTSITIGGDGLPVISYSDGTNLDLKVAHCGNAACTAGNTLTTVDSAGTLGQFYSSITIGGDGLPVISYFDGTNGDLKVAHCGNAACTAGNTITTVESAVGVDVNSITIGADGLPVISYHDASNGDVKVAHCGNAACSAGNTLTTVDVTGNVGYSTSITIGADGLPVISYYDFTNWDLKVAHCGNAACSTACGVGGTICTTVDSAGTVGGSTSITMGADGLPVISYYDGTNDDVKVAHCGNAACSTVCGVGGTICTTVDSAGDVGQDMSLTVGPDGLPIISYYDLSNSNLKVAHCSNRFCTPYHRPR